MTKIEKLIDWSEQITRWLYTLEKRQRDQSIARSTKILKTETDRVGQTLKNLMPRRHP